MFIEKPRGMCPRCRSMATGYVMRALPITSGAWSPNDPHPEWAEDCNCGNCGHFWSQRVKGDRVSLIDAPSGNG